MKIKSSIRNYTVEFSNNFIKSIDQIYNDGDIIIFDNILYTPAGDLFPTRWLVARPGAS